MDSFLPKNALDRIATCVAASDHFESLGSMLLTCKDWSSAVDRIGVRPMANNFVTLRGDIFLDCHEKRVIDVTTFKEVAKLERGSTLCTLSSDGTVCSYWSRNEDRRRLYGHPASQHPWSMHWKSCAKPSAEHVIGMPHALAFDESTFYMFECIVPSVSGIAAINDMERNSLWICNGTDCARVEGEFKHGVMSFTRDGSSLVFSQVYPPNFSRSTLRLIRTQDRCIVRTVSLDSDVPDIRTPWLSPEGTFVLGFTHIHHLLLQDGSTLRFDDIPLPAQDSLYHNSDFAPSFAQISPDGTSLYRVHSILRGNDFVVESVRFDVATGRLTRRTMIDCAAIMPPCRRLVDFTFASDGTLNLMFKGLRKRTLLIHRNGG